MTSTPARSLQESLARLGYKREGPCITTQSAGDPLVREQSSIPDGYSSGPAMASDTCPNWQPRPSFSRRLMFPLHTVPRTLVQNPFASPAAVIRAASRTRYFTWRERLHRKARRSMARFSLYIERFAGLDASTQPHQHVGNSEPANPIQTVAASNRLSLAFSASRPWTSYKVLNRPKALLKPPPFAS